MTTDQKMAYAEALLNLTGALALVQRCAVVTNVGIDHVIELNKKAKALNNVLMSTRAVPAPKVKPAQPAVRDLSPMRPSYRGD